MSIDAVERAEAEDDREFEGLFARHSSARTLLATILVGLLAVLGLRFLSPEPRPADFDEPAGRADVEAALLAAVASPARRVVLFLGDSVLRPNVMRERGIAEAEQATPVAWARRLASADVAFFDLSLDGLLPADMATIATELDEIDPDRRVELVVELSPRYLSPDYATAERAHARAFLARQEHYWPIEDDLEDAHLTRHRLGLGRTRRALGGALARPERFLLAGPRVRDDARARLRIARHFLARAGWGKQQAALAALARSAAEGRPALFFLTPVSGQGLGRRERTPPEIRAAGREFRVLLGAEGPPRLVDLDDGRFGADDFLDHVHLRPAANARLAARLLATLGLVEGEAEAPVARRTIFPEAIGALPGAFLDRDRVLLPRADRPALLVDLARGRVAALAEVLPAAPVADGRGGLLAFAPGPRLLAFAEGEANEVAPPAGGWPFAEPPGFDRSGDTILAVAGTTLHRITIAAGGRRARIEGAIELPPEFRDARPRIGADRLYLARPDAGGGYREIHAIALADLAAGRLDRLELFARCAPDADWERDLVAASGLKQRNRDRLAMPFARFLSVRVAGPALVLEAPLPGAPETIVPWRLALDAGVVQALLEPGRDGLVLAPGRAPERGLLAFDPESGRALVARDGGAALVETALLHRSDWTYGAPPWPAADIVVANGFSHRRREPCDLRVGLFGSSRVGAAYPGLVPDSRKLMSSLSLATELGRELDERLLDLPGPARALDYSQARSDLLRSLATLHEIEVGALDRVIIAIDDESLGDPDAPRGQAAPRLPERYRAIRRDSEGRPLITRQAGFRPRLVFDAIPAAATGAAKAAIEDCVLELDALARARGAQFLFLDLTGLGEAEDPEIEVLRAAIAGLGLPLLDARALALEDAPGLAEFSYGQDPHLRPEAIRALARALARRLEPELRRDLFAGLVEGRSPAEAPGRAGPLLPPGAVLDAQAARREDVAVERSLTTDARLVYDLGPEPEDVAPWRRALALLGYRGAPPVAPGDELIIEIIRFASYDEYGLGRDEAPETVARFAVAAKDLEGALAEIRGALAEDRRPGWLGQR